MKNTNGPRKVIVRMKRMTFSANGSGGGSEFMTNILSCNHKSDEVDYYGVRKLACAFAKRACPQSQVEYLGVAKQASLRESGGKPPHSKGFQLWTIRIKIGTIRPRTYFVLVLRIS